MFGKLFRKLGWASAVTDSSLAEGLKELNFLNRAKAEAVAQAMDEADGDVDHYIDISLHNVSRVMLENVLQRRVSWEQLDKVRELLSCLRHLGVCK